MCLWWLALASQCMLTSWAEDFMHFLMAFQVVDVCFAHRSWHSRSFQNCAGKLELRF